MLGNHLNHCEDSLTASILSHLLHLPAEVFWKLLWMACCQGDLPEHVGEPRSIEFFPKWNSAGTDNSIYVEPDAFLRFRDFDLIIEAKRWDDNGTQNRQQWKQELVAYANEFGEERKPVGLLALGGLFGLQTEEITHTWRADSAEDGGYKSHRFDCRVVMCRWRALLDQCKRMRREIARAEYPDSRTFATGRILDDVIGLFASHSFFTGRWFSEFDFAKHRLSSAISAHHQLFRSRSLQLSHT